MTVSDLQGDSPTGSLLSVIFLTCAAIGKISADIARRAVPLR